MEPYESTIALEMRKYFYLVNRNADRVHNGGSGRGSP